MREAGASALAGLLVLLSVSSSVLAHESRPLYIELVQTDTLRYQLQWKTPLTLPAPLAPFVALPDTCGALAPVAEVLTPGGVVRRVAYRCREELSGQPLAIEYPAANPSISTLIRYTSRTGERHTALLGPQEARWRIPATESVSSVGAEYLRLGVEHILRGVDHLLFLVCLLWIAGTWRRILLTVTGFTIAHSLTLAASALQLVRLPAAPVEAAIALSILFLAVEIAKGPRDSLTWRRPITVSGSFGLLHGFGFAAALGEIGLPQSEVLAGLLFFNLGVEVGQVLFAAGLCGIWLLMRSLVPSGFARETAWPIASSYVVGSVASYWLLDRLTGFLPAVT